MARNDWSQDDLNKLYYLFDLFVKDGVVYSIEIADDGTVTANPRNFANNITAYSAGFSTGFE